MRNFGCASLPKLAEGDHRAGGATMSEQERPLMDRVWEFTKDISVKVSRKAEKHWKINTLRVEIASIRHRINVKYKELGRYVYESVKSQTLEEDSYKASLREFFDELKRLEGEIFQRENRIEILEQEMRDDPAEPPPFQGNGSDGDDQAATPDVVEAEVVSESVATSENQEQAATEAEDAQEAAEASKAAEASETDGATAKQDAEPAAAETTDSDADDSESNASDTSETKEADKSDGKNKQSDS